MKHCVSYLTWICELRMLRGVKYTTAFSFQHRHSWPFYLITNCVPFIYFGDIQWCTLFTLTHTYSAISLNNLIASYSKAATLENLEPSCLWLHTPAKPYSQILPEIDRRDLLQNKGSVAVCPALLWHSLYNTCVLNFYLQWRSNTISANNRLLSE
jgi:hypothetical protein